jgi:uncharacterized membrane protein
MSKKPKSIWRIPVLLLALGLLPVLFGTLQLFTIQQGIPADGVISEMTSAQYFKTPFPIVSHIVSGIFFSLLAPFQFVTHIRKRWPKWHRITGRLLIVSGITFALTALWMNHYFPAYGGTLKYSGIFVFAVGEIIALALAVYAILRRNIAQHRAWMMRTIAIALGGGTQRLFLLPAFFALGGLNDLTLGIGIWFGFSLNVVVVEWILCRERTHLQKLRATSPLQTTNR